MWRDHPCTPNHLHLASTWLPSCLPSLRGTRFIVSSLPCATWALRLVVCYLRFTYFWREAIRIVSLLFWRLLQIPLYSSERKHRVKVFFKDVMCNDQGRSSSAERCKVVSGISITRRPDCDDGIMVVYDSSPSCITTDANYQQLSDLSLHCLSQRNSILCGTLTALGTKVLSSISSFSALFTSLT